jgi:mevalonate kinase
LTYLQSQSTSATPSKQTLNTYAFLGEKILHGTPSGVDNACAVFGGGVAFRRAVSGRPGGMENITGFRELPLLITDTRVPRDTKSLVRGVGEMKEQVRCRQLCIMDLSF